MAKLLPQNLQKKQLFLSPSDIACSVWSWQDFYDRCVLGKRSPNTPAMDWGTFCHTYVQSADETRFPIQPDFLTHLDRIREELKGCEKEVFFQKTFTLDDWEITLSYRLDAVAADGKAIELKFPQTMWTQYKANFDIKTLCYRMFHDNIEVWCLAPQIVMFQDSLGEFDMEDGFALKKFTVKTSKEKAEEIVKEQLKAIIGRLQLNYF